MPPFFADDLVDLVEKDDSGLFDLFFGLGHHLVHIHQPLGRFLGEQVQGLGHRHPTAARLFGHQIAEHVLEVDAQLLHAGVGKDFHHGGLVFAGFQLDGARVQLSFVQHAAQLFTGGTVVFEGLNATVARSATG